MNLVNREKQFSQEEVIQAKSQGPRQQLIDGFLVVNFPVFGQKW